MPLKTPRGGIHPGADREISVPVSEEHLARLNTAAKACGVTTFAFLLAGISIALSVYCGSEDVTLGFPADMRSAEEKNMAGISWIMKESIRRPLRMMVHGHIIRHHSSIHYTGSREKAANCIMQSFLAIQRFLHCGIWQNSCVEISQRTFA